MRQLSLFDPPPQPAGPTARPTVPQPAPAGAEVAELAGRLPATIRLGTSSWSFPGWAGLIYAETATRQTLSRDGLPAYAAQPLLGTVGVDSGFYAPLDPHRLAAYAAQVPTDFRFLVKAPARITDRFQRDRGGRPSALNPHFLDPGRAADEAVGPFLDGLGAHAGVLLFQLPPMGRELTDHPRRFAEDLYRFLIRLPKGPCYAIELRDSTLLTADLAAALHHGGAAPGLAVHPRLPAIPHQLALMKPSLRQDKPLVIRWLLRRNRGYAEARARYQPFDRLAEPDPETRLLLVAALQDALASTRQVYLIANNKAEGCAPLTLIALAKALLGVEPAGGGARPLRHRPDRP